MARRNSTSKLPFIVIFLIVTLLSYGGYLLINDTEPPEIELSHQAAYISPTRPIVVTATDSSSPIKSITAKIIQNGDSVTVAEENFKDKKQVQQLIFSLENMNIPDGASFELEVTARDASYGGFGFGNRKKIILPLRIDSTPPVLTVKSSTPAVRKGGTGCLVYSLSKDVQQSGVKVGEYFFSGHRQPNGDYLCFFAFPYNMEIKDYFPRLFAMDLAGNLQEQELIVNKINRVFKSDTINVSQGFLNAKSAEFTGMVPGDMNELERFLQVNGPIRKANAISLVKIGQNTAPDMLWNGSFQRLPRAASRAGFADHRSYMWDGQKVDEQTHLGFDLASVKNAPVPASNSGIVVFSGYLGIYGNLVIIDHGLGLQSLYSHMSEISVAEGETVEKGQIIGKTGATGMAGGDHLHFGILVGGLEVTPLEWLDAQWIKNNVIDRIVSAGGTAPSFEVSAAESATSTEADPPPAPQKPAKKNVRKQKRSRR